MPRLFVKSLSAILAALIVLPTAALAHDTWLLPMRSDSSSAMTFELTSGMDFPNADYSIPADRVAARGCRMEVADCILKMGVNGEHALALSANVAGDTPALLWVDLAPKTLSLDGDKVEEYLAEIDPPPSVRAAYMAQPEPRHWRETYVKHSKALLGTAVSTPTAWSKPVGSTLEIVPSADSRLALDSDARFRVMSHGKPLADFAIGVVGGTAAKPRLLRTDADGDITVRIDQRGYWLLRVTELNPSTTKDIDWDSHFATLAFDVR
ncbi:MAG: DUF4198 domain-containing protein [Dokdonella sp.]